jgi:hypothetical protein
VLKCWDFDQDYIKSIEFGGILEILKILIPRILNIECLAFTGGFFNFSNIF